MEQIAVAVLAKLLENDSNTKITICIPKKSIANMFGDTSYNLIQQIVEILSNNDFSDFECVEEMVSLLGKFGIECGNRHDF